MSSTSSLHFESFRTTDPLNIKSELTEWLSCIFKKAISITLKSSNDDVFEKFENGNHFFYLKEYFTHDSNQMIPDFAVVEHPYYSQDYISDYSNFHSYCFNDYGRNCSRIHFFSQPKFGQVSKSTFLNFIKGKISQKRTKDFENSYIGYMVVKPTPKRFIGKTILKPFSQRTENNNESRVFWGIREYNQSIFGRKISINSLAYQEQDKTVSACSTAAIWSVLNQINLDSHINNSRFSASEITMKSSFTEKSNRIFPNKAFLNLPQIKQVFENYNLATQHYLAPNANQKIGGRVDDSFILTSNIKKIVFAYSLYKTPIIMIIDPPSPPGQMESVEGSSLHAIVISGHRETSEIIDQGEMVSGSSRITKLYAHDDQFGPFVQLNLSDDDSSYTVHSIWDFRYSKDNIPNTAVKAIIIPISERITISFDEISAITSNIELFLLTHENYYFKEEYIKPIYTELNLWISNDYKEALRNSPYFHYNPEGFFEILTTPLPKYIWVHRVFFMNKEKECFPYADIIFDATDLKESETVLISLFYTPTIDYRQLFKDANSDPVLPSLAKDAIKALEEELNKTKAISYIYEVYKKSVNYR